MEGKKLTMPTARREFMLSRIKLSDCPIEVNVTQGSDRKPKFKAVKKDKS